MGCKVLIAEDDRALGKTLHMALEAEGHKVLAVVPTGEEAVEMALRAHPDVVIMDVGLAGEINGIQAARRLRRRSSCPVVFHTAHADAEHRARMLAIRNATVVRKPCPIAQLLAAVKASAH